MVVKIVFVNVFVTLPYCYIFSVVFIPINISFSSFQHTQIFIYVGIYIYYILYIYIYIYTHYIYKNDIRGFVRTLETSKRRLTGFLAWLPLDGRFQLNIERTNLGFYINICISIYITINIFNTDHYDSLISWISGYDFNLTKMEQIYD